MSFDIDKNKKKIGVNTLDLIEQMHGKSKSKTKRKKKSKKENTHPVSVENYEEENKTDNASLMDFIVKDFLKEMGHTTKLEYINLNRTFGMQKIIEGKIERLVKSGKNDFDTERSLAMFMKIFKDYASEIRQQSVELGKKWEQVEKRTHDKEMMKVFENLRTFIQFLADRGEHKLLRDFQETVYTKGYKVEDVDE